MTNCANKGTLKRAEYFISKAWSLPDDETFVEGSNPSIWVRLHKLAYIVKKMQHDSEKPDRRNSHQCRLCYYVKQIYKEHEYNKCPLSFRIYKMFFVHRYYVCKKCRKIKDYTHDKLCISCSVKNDLCISCGCDIDLDIFFVKEKGYACKRCDDKEDSENCVCREEEPL